MNNRLDDPIYQRASQDQNKQEFRHQSIQGKAIAYYNFSDNQADNNLSEISHQDNQQISQENALIDNLVNISKNIERKKSHSAQRKFQQFDSYIENNYFSKQSKIGYDSTRLNQPYYSRKDFSKNENIGPFNKSYTHYNQNRSYINESPYFFYNEKKQNQQQVNPYSISINSLSIDINKSKSKQKKHINQQFHFNQLKQAQRFNKLVDQVNTYPGNNVQDYLNYLKQVNSKIKIRNGINNFQERKMHFFDSFMPQGYSFKNSSYRLMKYRWQKKYSNNFLLIQQ